jgi:hypothetical protein
LTTYKFSKGKVDRQQKLFFFSAHCAGFNQANVGIFCMTGVYLSSGILGLFTELVKEVVDGNGIRSTIYNITLSLRIPIDTTN